MAPEDTFERRFVVCATPGPDPWTLPASTTWDRTWIYGGERTLYELAVALASLGHQVELRGAVVRPILYQMTEAAGSAPTLPEAPRPPGQNDAVIVPEGWNDLLFYTGIALSPARTIMLVLAAPGLFGPPFELGWTQQDPLTVEVGSLARPRHFREIHALGFEVWTNSPALHAAANDAGVPARFMGRGIPVPLPLPEPKTHDVALVTGNRWAPLARRVAARLDVPVLEIPEGAHDSVIRALARTRILIFPSRVEGDGRLQTEARAVGVVPVGLATNPFMQGFNEEGGVVLVASLDEMPAAIRGLLDDPDRLRTLAERAVRTGREQLAWDAFLTRLKELLDLPAAVSDGRQVRSAIGELLRREDERHRAKVTALRDGVAERDRALGVTQAHAGQLSARIAKLEGEVSELRALAEERRGLHERLAEEHVQLASRRSVRWALVVARLLRPILHPRHGGP